MKKNLLIILLFVLLFIPIKVNADTWYDVNFEKNESELNVSVYDQNNNDLSNNYGDVFEFTNNKFIIKAPGRYSINIWNNGYSDLVIEQTTKEAIYLNVNNYGSVTLNNVNISYTDGIYALGDGRMLEPNPQTYVTINNSKIYAETYYTSYGYGGGNILSEGNVNINNSEITFIPEPGDTDFLNRNKIDANGNINIMNGSKVKLSYKINSEAGSVSISDSSVYVGDEWGFINAKNNVSINNSDVKFLFGVKANDVIINKSNVDAIEKQNMYAINNNNGNQGWIQADNSLSVADSELNIVNSITSDKDLKINKSDITLSGKYTDNGYVQSSDGNIEIKNSNIMCDKDVFAEYDILIEDSEVEVSGYNSKAGYLESYSGAITIKNSKVTVDEGMDSEKDMKIEGSTFEATGKNSKRGYVEVYNGTLVVDDSTIKTNERVYNDNKTTFNKANVVLSSGIKSKGIDIVDSDFYASNKDTEEILSTTSPVVSLDKVLIKNSQFVAESINDTPSIASLGEITVIDDQILNNKDSLLDVIIVDAANDNFLSGGNREFFKEGDKIYTTALNGSISNYSTVKAKEEEKEEPTPYDKSNDNSEVNVPDTFSDSLTYVFVVLAVIGLAFFIYKRKVNIK